MYTNVNGNNGNNFINFLGISGVYAQTLVNPYTGFTITIHDVKNINNAVYDGLGGIDTLVMSLDGDVLSLLDANGTIMIKNIEIINASDGGDIINFAFVELNYGDLIIRGAGGDDILWGNNGNDTLLGAQGRDNIIGGGGNDFLFGGDEDDYLDGGLGIDYMAGGSGDDHLVYNADGIWGNVTLADLGSPVFFASLVSLSGKNRSYDSFHGDTEDDGSISINKGYDTLTLTSGNDVLLLVDSFSPYIGPAGVRVSYIDYIDAGAGDDVIDLSGADHVAVTIDGGDGNDVLIGTGGDDTLNGGADNDWLYGAKGNDILRGGDGDDVYFYALGDGSDVIAETLGSDAIHFDAGISLSEITFVVDGDHLLLQIGDDTITIENHYAPDHAGRVETIVFADGSVFDLGNYVPNEAPVAQDDSFAAYRNEIITGNVLADNGRGADTDIDGDVLTVQPLTITTLHGGRVEIAADGSFIYTPASDYIGSDQFEYTVYDGRGGEGYASVSLKIDHHPDDIVGNDQGGSITGTDGNDHIFGGSGNDIIKGMDGDDYIRGGDGDDILYGDDGILSGIILDKIFSDSVTMPDLKERVNIADLTPSGLPALGIAHNNLSVDFQASATITFRKGHAGYDNSFGSFGVAQDGTIVSSVVHWANVKTAGVDVAHTIDLPVGEAGGNFGFFIIDNGNNTNNGYAGLNITGAGNVQFFYNYGKIDARAAKITDAGSKITAIYDDGVTVKVLKGNVYFTTERDESAVLNKDGKTHVVSGLMDINDLTLNPVKADLASKSVTLMKNGITIEALTGALIANGDRIGIKSSASGDTIGGNEEIRITFDHAADKVALALSDIAGGNTGIDFKIYIDGSNDPVFYEYRIGAAASGGKIGLMLNGADFGGLITGIEISSKANSALGTETFYVDNVKAFIPGGEDTDSIRIGFEDLYNIGDGDYEDVLFDLNINEVNIGDIHGGNDILDGGAGNDILYGEGGDDILYIGLGADHAYGGLGVDVFAINHIDDLVDTIHDFSAAQGDRINIFDVLEGYDPLSRDINDFIQLVQNGNDTEIRINADGDHDGVFELAALVLGTSVDLSSIVADHTALA